MNEVIAHAFGLTDPSGMTTEQWDDLEARARRFGNRCLVGGMTLMVVTLAGIVLLLTL
jgi:hypothetical protein